MTSWHCRVLSSKRGHVWTMSGEDKKQVSMKNVLEIMFKAHSLNVIVEVSEVLNSTSCLFHFL